MMPKKYMLPQSDLKIARLERLLEKIKGATGDKQSSFNVSDIFQGI